MGRVQRSVKRKRMAPQSGPHSILRPGKTGAAEAPRPGRLRPDAQEPGLCLDAPRRRWMVGGGTSLSRRLMLLVAAVALPLALLGAGSLWAQYRSERARAEAQLVVQARTLAQLVDREFDRAEVVARTLTHSATLARGDLDAFGRELRAAADLLSADLPPGAQPAVLRLVRADRTRLLDTSSPPGTRSTDLVPMQPHLAAALASGRPTISNLFIAQELNRPLVAVAVPFHTPGAAASEPWGAIGISVPRERLAGLIASVGLPPGGFASVQDRAGKTVVRSLRDAETVGKLPMTAVLAAIMAADSGMAPRGARTLEGVPSAIAFAHAPISGFIVKLDVPEEVFLAPLHASLLRSAIIGALVLGGGLLIASLLARRVVTAFRRVPRLAAAGTVSGGTGLREADELTASLAAILAERQQAEQALKASEARFRTLADTTPQMVWSATPDGRHDYFNARWHSFTGLTAAEDTSGAWRKLVHPEEWDVLDSRWQHALRTGTPYEAEYRLRRHDGAWRWVLARALPMRDETGRILRWFGCLMEIQEIVEARDILARSREELEQLVAARTRDLEATQAQLAQAQRMEALGQLAGGIAHDFNNVLQAMLGGAALIERQAGKAEGVRQLARMLTQAAERGASITRRLLAFARRSDLRAEPMDAAGLLTSLRELLDHTLGGGIEVRVQASLALPPLLADKGQLETVLVNLATNARDAMSGTGTLTLTAEAETVLRGEPLWPQGTTLRPGRYLRLSVADTGSGMDAATLARATEPFFTTKPVGQGTGLGLSMAKGFAEQSGGALRIESERSQGTTISLWFPVAEDRSPAAFPPAPLSHRPFPRRARLLLVEDEPIVRTVIAAQLEAAGHSVLTAGSAAAALGLLDTGAPVDLMLSDLSMPGMDGLGLIREAQRRRPGLPAILLTGFVTDAAEIALGGALSGAFSLLNKPIEAERLLERIAALLESSQAEAAEQLQPPSSPGRPTV